MIMNVNAEQIEVQPSVPDNDVKSPESSDNITDHTSADSVVDGGIKLLPYVKAAILISSLMIIALMTVFIADSLYRNSDSGISYRCSSNTPMSVLSNDIFARYNTRYKVYVNIEDERSVTVETPPLTVGEVVEQIHESFDSDYALNYEYDDIIDSDMSIEVSRLTFDFVTVNEYVPYETEVIEVGTIPKGTRVTVQSGVEKYVTRVYKKTYLNEELHESIILSEKVLKEGQVEIVYEGIGGSYTASNGKIYMYSYYIDVEATAYGVDNGYGGDSPYTYTGKPVKRGMIAVDPEIIPLGSSVYIEDFGVCKAEDIGGAILGNHIDIYLGDDLEEQLSFGRKQLRVYVLE